MRAFAPLASTNTASTCSPSVLMAASSSSTWTRTPHRASFPSPASRPAHASSRRPAARSATFWPPGRTTAALRWRRCAFTPQYENQKLSGLDITIADRGVTELDPAHRPIRQVSFIEDDGRRYVAAIVGDEELVLWRTEDPAIRRSPQFACRPARCSSTCASAGTARWSRRLGGPHVPLGLRHRRRRPRLTDDVLVGSGSDHGDRVSDRRNLAGRRHLERRGHELVSRGAAGRGRGADQGARLRAAGRGRHGVCAVAARPEFCRHRRRWLARAAASDLGTHAGARDWRRRRRARRDRAEGRRDLLPRQRRRPRVRAREPAS